MGDRLYSSSATLEPLLSAMGKAMKAKTVSKKGGKSITVSAINDAVASKSGMKAKEVKGVIQALAAVGADEIKKSGKFTVPGLAMLKLKHKPPTPAGKRSMFGKVVTVKAMKASKKVKAFAVSAFKKAAGC